MKNEPLISALEPRLLFDGAAVATAVEVLDNNSFENSETNENVETKSVEKKQIAFIDESVKDKDTLIEGLDENTEVFIIDNDSNGLEQISQILKDKNSIDTIHIFSHGKVGEVTLGNTTINNENIDNFSNDFSQIENSLNLNADILLYGCSVSANGQGKDFVDKISSLTNADVAASTDLTGASSLGGDWDLEYKVGQIESEVLSFDNYDETFANAAPVISTSNDFASIPATAFSLPDAADAFDDNPTTQYTNPIGAGTEFTFDSSGRYIIDSITVTTSNTTAPTDPTKIILWGSNDNNVYTKITTVIIDPPSDASRSFANDQIFRYYKVEVATVRTPGASLSITEIDIGGSDVSYFSYNENDGPTSVITNLILSDMDSANLEGATVSLSNGTFTDGDILSFLNDNNTLYGGISASYDSLTGVLNLSGTATLIQYENALKAVKFHSTSDSPNTTNTQRTLSWQVTDGTDSSNVANSLLDIVPQNDAPTIDSGTTSGTIVEDSVVSQSGTIIYTDPDLVDTPTVDLISTNVTGLRSDGSTSLFLSPAQIDSITDAFNHGVLAGNTNTGTISWNYSISNNDINFLAQGETITAIFTLQVDDQNGETINQDVTITINGTNDVPTIIPGDISGSVVDGGVVTDNGSISFIDLDNTDRPVITESLKSIDALKSDNSVLSLTSAQQSAIENAFSIFPLASNTNLGTVNWTYTIAQSDIQFLGAGETVTAVFTISVTDDSGAIQTQDVSITLNGTNTSPQTTAIDVTGNLSEGTTLNDSGSISFSDLDMSDRPIGSESLISIGMVDANGSIVNLTPAQLAVLENAFSINNLGTNTNNGVVEWTYAISESDLGFLGEGDSITAVFEITVQDGSNASSSENVTISIIGQNDSPVITPIDTDGQIQEGSTLNDSGSITFADIDISDRPLGTEVTKSVSAVKSDNSVLNLNAAQQSAIENAFSILNLPSNTNSGTIQWNYNINEADLDFLANGEVVTAVFTITVTDDENQSNQQDITITIRGANDAPTVSAGGDSGTITESVVLNDNGSFTFNDVDLTNQLSTSESLKSLTAYRKDGTTVFNLSAQQQNDLINAFNVNSIIGTNSGTVNWDYTISESNLDFLAEGERVDIVFTINVIDNENAVTQKDISITLNGTNDAPVVAGDDIDVTLVYADEYVQDIAFLFSDVDNSDILTYDVIGLPDGITFDANTGLISGVAQNIGKFIIEIRAYDSSSSNAMVSRTYEMNVIGPPDVVEPNKPEVKPYEPPIEVNPVEVTPISEDEIKGVIKEETQVSEELKQSEISVDDLGRGYIQYESIVSNSITSNNEKNLLKNIDIVFNPRSIANISESQDEAYNVLGMSIESVSLNETFLELKITDIKVKQIYEVSLENGEPLPSNIVFDEKTGFIRGNIFDDLELTIKAVGEDGKIRILNIKIDISALKEEELEVSSNDKEIGIQEQLASQNNKMQTYGNSLSSLFDDV